MSWLLTIAHNKLVDALRRRDVEAAAREKLRMRPIELAPDDVEQIEAIAAETDLIATLTRLLTPEQMDALRARVLEERDYSEIASELRCSEAVVRKRVSRALITLRRQMEGSR